MFEDISQEEINEESAHFIIFKNTWAHLVLKK